MWGIRTREEHAEFNRIGRLNSYPTWTFWAAVGGIGPIGCFFSEKILKTPEPISATFEGYESDGVPMGDTYKVYSYEWASPGDHTLNVLGFVLGIFVAIAVALIFYCIARFAADPIMYKIDLKTEMDSPLQLWLKRIVMVVVVLLYCGTIVLAAVYTEY